MNSATDFVQNQGPQPIKELFHEVTPLLRDQNAGGAGPSEYAGAQPFDLGAVQSVCPLVRPEQHVVSMSGSALPNIGNEKFLILRHRLSMMRHKQSLKTILITSSVPQEGKTVVSVNLAVTLARTSSRVLLVDADLRKPAVQGTLGLPHLPGLSEYLAGRHEATTFIRQVVPVGLYVLPAGRPSTNPVGLLQSARMRELIARARTTFDWVIFDSPPVNPFADAPCLASLSDGVLMVTRSGLTQRDFVQRTLRALEGTLILGVVLNAVEDAHGDSQYYYYYQKSLPKNLSSGVFKRSLPAAKREAKRG